MACILVNEVNENEELSHNAIISVSNNKPLYGECDSDIHAEIAAIGDACRNGISTNNATAYITMPPCKRCFAALTVAGIRKIVTRYDPPKKIQETAIRENIEFIKICNQAEQMTRINFLVNGDSEGKKRKNSSTDENYNHAKKVQNGKKNEN
jgi:deoxycytidylate deaminase